MIFLDRYSEHSYAVFRIVTGFMFLCHGTQKLLGLPIAFPRPLAAMGTSAAVIQIVAGALIITGFYSRYAAFIASGTMAVAYWMVHGLKSPFPIANGGEISALYCFALLFFISPQKGLAFGV